MALFALYHRADGEPVDRQRGQRLDRRQSVPLHRLPADRRRGARVMRGARERLVLDRGAGRTARAHRTARQRGHLRRQPRAFLRRARRASMALAKLYYANPDATLIAGSTDVGLWVTKQLRDLPKVIWLGRVKGLDEIEDRGDAVCVSARWSTHAEAMPYLAAIDRDLGELMRRFAGTQVRMAATVGGNIANGSPIGSSPFDKGA